MKKIAFFGVVLLSFFIIQSLVRSIITLWEKQDLVVAQQQELAQLKKEHATLKEQEKKVNNPGFVEEEARNKLFLVKPDEKIVLVPTDVLSAKDIQKPKEKKSVRPAYQQWMQFFVNGKL